MDQGRSVVGVKAAAGLLMLAGISFAPMSEASGSCSAPVLALEVPRTTRHGVHVGDHTVVTGSSFVWGCAQDADDREDGAERAMERVPLTLRQGSKEWTLGVEDAGTLPDETFGTVAWHVRIPGDARPGRAVLSADSAVLRIHLTEGRLNDGTGRRTVVRRASSRRTPGR